MTIASEITRLQTAKSDIKTAIESKGVSVPSSAKLDTYDDYINAIVKGGGDYDEESIVYIMQANSNGYLYVPLTGFNTSGSQSCNYNWKVSVDGGPETTYTGRGSGSGSIQLTGYTSSKDHVITIKPVTESYGWARAYGWGGLSTKTLLHAVLYDGSYKGYGVSATDTGGYFRISQYSGCTNLRSIPVDMENMPDTVTTIGDYFMNYMFYNCTNLFTPANEKISKNVTTIGTGFRGGQYKNTNVSYAPEESLPDSVSVTSTTFRDEQYSGTQVALIKGIKEPSSANSSYYRNNQFNNTQYKRVKVLNGLPPVGWYGTTGFTDSYVQEVKVPSNKVSQFKSSSLVPRGNITDSKFVGY